MGPVAEAAADALADEASVEILDIRSLKPLDEEALLPAAAKTRPPVGGQGGAAGRAARGGGGGGGGARGGGARARASSPAERAMLDLRAPIVRVTGYDV